MANTITRQIIFKKLETIENKVGKMAHEITNLADELKRWQDGDLRDVYFSEFLSKMIDEIEAA